MRILVISWNYPTVATPQRGLWVERMCRVAAKKADVCVIVPTAWIPPLMPVAALARIRRVPARLTGDGVDAYFPRVPGSLEYWTVRFDARLAFARVLALARRLHAEKPFDLIHAHFIYPDGVLASGVGEALGIPVMTSEHAFWTPWLPDQPAVYEQVKPALGRIRLVTAVSEFLRASIDQFANGRIRTAVLPNVVDEQVFSPAPAVRDPHGLLYVGLIRGFKRLDVLLHALAIARRTNPALHLRILSAVANTTPAYRRDRQEVRRLISSLGLERAVRIVQGAQPTEVAEAMRRCAFVVVSSTRRETFCSVAAESLACGTPLVITRCGGPEEFVTPDDGVMVEADDPAALADGILRALEVRDRFDPEAMHRRILERFGYAAWLRRAMPLYEGVAADHLPSIPDSSRMSFS